MSELSSEMNPQILVNGKDQEQLSSITQDNEGSEENISAETQAKMHSVFQQVREQIRSQVGAKAPKSGILELVQRVIDRETEALQVNGEAEGKEVSREEEKQEEVLTGKGNLTQEELCAFFQEKIATCEKTLRDEFEVQIAQVRKEMKAYTDQALKDLECKMQSQQPNNPQQTPTKDQQESKAPEKKQKPTATPSWGARRGRVLTRTMTTIIPKTCTPVIIGPRAKSETLSTSHSQASRILPRDPLILRPVNRSCQSRRPLPPTCPPLNQRKKPLKAKTSN